MNFHGHHPNQACLLLLLLRFFSSSPSMCSETSALIFCPKTTLPLPVYTLTSFSMACKHLSGSLRRKLSSYSTSFGELSRYACARASWTRNKNKKVLPPAHRSIWISNRLQTAAGICLNSAPGGKGHEAVAGGDSCRRATASSVSSALSSTYYYNNNNNKMRARSLALV